VKFVSFPEFKRLVILEGRREKQLEESNIDEVVNSHHGRIRMILELSPALWKFEVEVWGDGEPGSATRNSCRLRVSCHRWRLIKHAHWKYIPFRVSKKDTEWKFKQKEVKDEDVPTE